MGLELGSGENLMKVKSRSESWMRLLLLTDHRKTEWSYLSCMTVFRNVHFGLVKKCLKRCSTDEVLRPETAMHLKTDENRFKVI